MTDRIREVTCQHCGHVQMTLLHEHEGKGLAFVCIECGTRNFLRSPGRQYQQVAREKVA